MPYPSPPTDTQVHVQVQACGVNFADIYTCQGLHRETNPPFVMGLECAGVIIHTGSQSNNLQVGDRVLVHTGCPGLHQEVVCVEALDCFVIPDKMKWEEAAALPVNYLTAYFCLADLGNLRNGQTVLIPSAGGGVGWAATQLARMVVLQPIFMCILNALFSRLNRASTGF